MPNPRWYGFYCKEPPQNAKQVVLKKDTVVTLAETRPVFSETVPFWKYFLPLALKMGSNSLEMLVFFPKRLPFSKNGSVRQAFFPKRSQFRNF